ncbi:hypothetical protein BSKO_08346 [Bryopsis sp. KO-2023]|nr:hypothetical protein BSKO_08346 [Bryopsis sp. KO-2023]
MERPGSRGNRALSFGGVSKAPTGNPIAPPPRPSTPGRMGTAVPAGPPPTAGRGAGMFKPAPPPTAQRLGTAGGRPGTGLRPGTASLNPNLQVGGERPATQQGMARIQGGSQGPGRQIFDKSYYMNILRQKKQDVLSINEEMGTAVMEFDKGAGRYQVLEERTGQLGKEVKEYQAQLAILNMIVDKAAMKSSGSDIAEEATALEEQNDADRRRIDKIFTERSEVQRQTAQIWVEIENQQDAMEAQLNKMPESVRQRYFELQSTIERLSGEVGRKEEEIAAIDRELATAEVEVARNPLKQRALNFQEEIKKLMAKKFELKAEAEKSLVSPEARREELIAEVKRENAEVELAAQQVKNLQLEIKQLEGRGGNPSGQSIPERSQAKEKMEELLQKNHDITSFIDGFESICAERMEEKRAREEAVVGVLDRVSRLEAMTARASKKNQPKETSADDVDSLTEELHVRRGELNKIDTLEGKIKEEQASLEEKTEGMKSDLERFGNLESMQKEATERRNQLEQEQMNLRDSLTSLKRCVEHKQQRYDAKNAQLQQSSAYAAVLKLETKLNSLVENVHGCRDAIRSKEEETDYKPLVVQVNRMATELDTALTKFGMSLEA